jgi:phosphatidylglycerol:prolipoprotein diacylglycerol transferase
MESLGWSFPFAWAVARFGCYLAHDHPGIPTSSWLGVQYPGGARYDLGLFDCFLAMAIGVAFARLDRLPRPRGFFITTFLLVYGPARLLLDNLRIEGRVAGLMSGQWGALVAIALGIFLLWQMRVRPAPARVPSRNVEHKWQMEYLAGD